DASAGARTARASIWGPLTLVCWPVGGAHAGEASGQTHGHVAGDPVRPGMAAGKAAVQPGGGLRAALRQGHRPGTGPKDSHRTGPAAAPRRPAQGEALILGPFPTSGPASHTEAFVLGPFPAQAPNEAPLPAV